MICERFDLLSIQEVQDNLDGLRHLKRRLGDDYGMVVSDTIDRHPAESGMGERLAFLFRKAVVQRTEIASDTTYDRKEVLKTVSDHSFDFLEDLKRRKPVAHFVTFIRQPFCESFEVGDFSTGHIWRFRSQQKKRVEKKTPDGVSKSLLGRTL
jgi:hypothetical protein